MSQRGVELFDTFLKNIAQYKEGDFSSTAYPFDTDQPVYIGELIDPKRQGISLKYAFYVLVNESDHGEDNLFKQALLLESGDEEGECDSVADYEVLLFLDFGGHNMLEMIDFGGDMDIDLLPEEINNCFEQSVEEILNIAKSNIEMVSQLKGVTPVVVVSGGTAKHVVIKRRLKDICSKNGIQKLRFVADLNIENESGYIARGVAYAACNRMTIEQYFRRGAAFGLQRKQNPSRGKGNPDGIWDDEASLVFSLVSGWADALAVLDHLFIDSAE
nr:uncharacterized protein CTRU02_14402 [Colletotrichum truncatum]KAF6782215.1 hypothetical protein CTRU02_14402 [Colletotrichum truncatum]